MNERIKQLMLDAGGQYSSGNQNDWPSWVLGDAVVDKFAELIVKECIQAFEAEVDTWKQLDPYQGSMKRKGTKAIKEHFGVEE